MADQKNEDEKRRALLAVMYIAKSDASCTVERLNRNIAHVNDLEISSAQCARYVSELNNELILLNSLLKPYHGKSIKSDHKTEAHYEELLRDLRHYREILERV